MIIIEDTRNQIGKHKRLNAEFEELGIQVIRSKLYVGDYARLDNQTVVIDTKKDWLEVAGNVTKQHIRFRKECQKAKDANIRLIILVEQNISAKDWKSPVNRFKKPITMVSGIRLQKIIDTMTEKYGVEFMWCDKRDTAQLILNLLEKV